eukprot:COSAG01_NODE_54126_length_334_cov_0.868085_1_plen_44_part_10
MLSGSARRLATIKATSSEVKLLAIPKQEVYTKYYMGPVDRYSPP